MRTIQNTQKTGGFLALIERVGNKIPDITMLFLIALVVVCAASFFLSFVQFSYIHPNTGKPIVINNMLSGQSLVAFLSSMVTNYINFPPLGMVVVATLGIGIAEGSGFINTGLKKLLNITPKKVLTPTIVLVGMLSHLAPDSGYVIIIPIAAFMFYAVGRHPLAGIGASFAGIAGAFAANFTPSAIDPVIQGFTQGAARIIDPNYEVNVLCNYFYSFIATVVSLAVCWYVTDRVVEPWLNVNAPVDKDLEISNDVNTEITPKQNKAFNIAAMAMLLMLLGLFAALYPSNSLLRDASGNIASFKAPIMQSIVPIIFLLFAVTGVVYGIISGTFKSAKDFTRSMEDITKTLVQFLVFAFFCAQFLYAFGKSNIGSLIAVSGAEFLKSLNMPPQITIFGIIVLTAFLNLIVTSASSKWAILAPIFVPMLMAVGIAPELTQAAFRISDSAVNVVTPMFAFYPLIILYCQKYVKNSGIGTLSSLMLPYCIGLLIGLSVLLYVMWWLNIPLGFQADYLYPRR